MWNRLAAGDAPPARSKSIRDGAQQLIEAYTYDPYNNRDTRSDGAATRYFEYDEAQQLKQIRAGSPTGSVLADFVYDANGNGNPTISDRTQK